MEVGWADLPPGILALISGCLQNPDDITRFRWVCRSWRLSTSPPNKLSMFFPRTLASVSHHTVNASAVYLLRPRFDPSKAWLVSVQEAVAGNLLVRHALTYDEISPGKTSLLDLSSASSSKFWISATQIAKSYAINSPCESCNRISTANNLVLVSNPPPGFRSSQLLGLCKVGDRAQLHLFAFTIGLSGETRIASRHVDFDEICELIVDDIINFNGRIYAVDNIGQIFAFDPTHIKMHKIDYGEDLWSFLCWAKQRRFVVSDGDLYVITPSYHDPTRCHVYKLVVDGVDSMISRQNRFGGEILNSICRKLGRKKIWEWEEVSDLGDRVFFIAKNCSFSMTVQDLPHPWEPNCVVFADGDSLSLCDCDPKSQLVRVFHLGGNVSSSEGYSDLFAPPLSWIDDQLKRDVVKKENSLSNWLA